MAKTKTNKISKQSSDLRKEVLDKFKKLYPPLFDNEDMLNQEELEQLVNEFSTPQTEKYEFRWAGKEKLIDDVKNLDIGFKVFKLASSYFPENTFAPDPDKSDGENKKALEAYIKKVYLETAWLT